MRIISFICCAVFALSCSVSAKKDTANHVPNAMYAHNDFMSSFQVLAEQLPDINTVEGSAIIDVAKLFLDTIYVGKTLEIGNDSAPVINVRELDCLTFIENAVALEKSQGNSDSFIQWITDIRYTNGQPKGYTSRLHYFSQWILDNVKMGWVEDVTCGIGGDTICFTTNFMSTHPQYYPQLQQNPSLIQEIKAIETAVSTSQFCYIPKGKLLPLEHKILDGDILGLTTNVKGLDFAHNGFAIHKNNRLYMLHASSDFKQVMVTEQPLYNYLMSMKHMTGIVVLRLTANH